MKLSLEGLKNKGEWEAAGIALPGYDVENAAKKSTGSSQMGPFGDRQYFPYFHRQYR